MSTEEIVNPNQTLIDFFECFSNPDPACSGIERFFSCNGHPEVFSRFSQDNEKLNLNKVQFNQLLILSGLASITFGFLRYYWLTLPNKTHPYNLEGLEGHSDDFDPSYFFADNELGDAILELKTEPDTDEPNRIFRKSSGDSILRMRKEFTSPLKSRTLKDTERFQTRLSRIGNTLDGDFVAYMLMHYFFSETSQWE